MSEALHVNSQVSVPRSEIHLRFVRSSGPGGQNVNKVASKVVLRWSVSKSAALSEPLRERVQSRLARRINDRGELILTSQRYRDQSRNIEDVLDKFRSLLLDALRRPRPRKKTRPPKGAREVRLKDKRATSEKKRRRQPPRQDQ